MTIIVNGFLGTLLITNGYSSTGFAPLPYGFTNPNAATLIGFAVADPASFCTSPDDAILVGFSVADPASSCTDPDAARLATP
jgi:hypothetical protein